MRSRSGLVVQTPEHGAAAGQGNAAVDDIGAQLRGRAPEGLLGAGDLGQALQQGLPHIRLGRPSTRLWPLISMAALLLGPNTGRPISILIARRCATDQQVVHTLDKAMMAWSKYIAGYFCTLRDRPRCRPERSRRWRCRRHSTIMLPVGSLTTCTDGSCHRLLDDT